MPDHVYPAALEDCYKVAEYVYANADQLGVSQDNIGVMGMNFKHFQANIKLTIVYQSAPGYSQSACPSHKL